MRPHICLMSFVVREGNDPKLNHFVCLCEILRFISKPRLDSQKGDFNRGLFSSLKPADGAGSAGIVPIHNKKPNRQSIHCDCTGIFHLLGGQYGLMSS